MGRPYTVLSEEMNKGIPNIFGALGIRTFYQDMLDRDKKAARVIQPLLKEIHWHYAARILETAASVAATSGAYAVFLTSFKCTPDSFVIDYFKRIMDAYAKTLPDTPAGRPRFAGGVTKPGLRPQSALSGTMTPPSPTPAAAAEAVPAGAPLDRLRSVAASLGGLRKSLPPRTRADSVAPPHSPRSGRLRWRARH